MEVPQEFGAAVHHHHHHHQHQQHSFQGSHQAQDDSSAKTHTRTEESLVPHPSHQPLNATAVSQVATSPAAFPSSTSTSSTCTPFGDAFPSRAHPFDRTVKAVGESRLAEAMAGYLSAYTSLRSGFVAHGDTMAEGGHAEVPSSSSGSGSHAGTGGGSLSREVAEQMQRVLHQHIVRVAKETRIEPAAMAAAVIYIERILTQHHALSLSEVNASRMALVAMLVAAKITTDMPYSNKWWAKVSGEFTLDDLNAMEIEFIKLLGFQNLHIEEEEYALHQERALSM